MRADLETTAGGRTACAGCRRPAEHCLCDAVRRVENRTPILILQDRRERGHPFGTARLAQQSLGRVELVTGRPDEFATLPGLRERMGGMGLLFPHATARDLSQLAPAERPAGLVVLDGTWRHARRMYYEFPELQGLPHFTLPAGLRSGYQVRKQPEDYCLSTLEAIYHSLRGLEPETPGLGGLLLPFEAMQARQLAAMDAGPRVPRRPLRPKGGPKLPWALTEGWEQAVVAYAELTAAGPEGHPRRLQVVRAERLATGERFERLIAPLEERDYLRLAPGDAERAVDEASFWHDWRAFFRPGDALLSWSRATLDHLREPSGQPPELLLRAAYFNLRPHRGSVEEVAAAEGVLPPEELARLAHAPRAEERHACALALGRYLAASGPR